MRRRYTPEFRERCVEQVRQRMEGTPSRESAVVAVAAALEIPVTSLRNWVRATMGPARGDDGASARTVWQLRQQVEVLRAMNRGISGAE